MRGITHTHTRETTMTATLIAHAGSYVATKDQVYGSKPVMDASKTYDPIGHGRFVDLIEEGLERNKWNVAKRSYALGKEGNGQLFGAYDLVASGNAGHTLCLGFRNSTDKSLQAGLACGSRVFVCDNLAFSSDIVIQTKHRAHVQENLPNLIDKGLEKFLIDGAEQEKEFAFWKQFRIDVASASNLICQAAEEKVIHSERLIIPVRAEFIKPRFNEFNDGGTAWSLYNAFTTIHRHVRTDVEPVNQFGALKLTHAFMRKVAPMPKETTPADALAN